MKNDIIEVMEACVDGTLDQIDLEFEDNAAVCVVLASDGYPVKYEKGYSDPRALKTSRTKTDITVSMQEPNLKMARSSQTVAVSLASLPKEKHLKEARTNAYEATEWISFANKYMRHDIGKAIDEA